MIVAFHFFDSSSTNSLNTTAAGLMCSVLRHLRNIRVDTREYCHSVA